MKLKPLTTAVCISGLLITAWAAHWSWHVHTFKLGIGTGRGVQTFINIYEWNKTCKSASVSQRVIVSMCILVAYLHTVFHRLCSHAYMYMCSCSRCWCSLPSHDRGRGTEGGRSLWDMVRQTWFKNYYFFTALKSNLKMLQWIIAK